MIINGALSISPTSLWGDILSPGGHAANVKEEDCHIHEIGFLGDGSVPCLVTAPWVAPVPIENSVRNHRAGEKALARIE